MKSYSLLLPLLLVVGGHLSAAPNPDYFRDADVKALVQKAEFWRSGLLKTAGNMKLTDNLGPGHVIWGVGDAVDMDHARQTALTGACSQVRSLFPGKPVRFLSNTPNQNMYSAKVDINGRRFKFIEVARWETGGRLKRAFLLTPGNAKK